MLAPTYPTLGYVAGTSFRHVIQPGAQHNETYWAERLPGALQLMLEAGAEMFAGYLGPGR